ncbi:MAG: cation:proton antiporter, partial [Proteobacteria bacterium]|nr:cation:proton antiporter [Pseudomonadota bacterium]
MGELIHLLQHLPPPYMLLVQACIVILIPYVLWRPMQLGRYFPLGVIQIFCGVLLGPAIFGALAPDLFKALFGLSEFAGKQVNRGDGILALATIAVCLFGFLAGADADKDLIRKSGRTVFLIGVPGMLIGWLIGSLAGGVIYYAIPAAHDYKPPVFSFALAYGLVIAVSALPILALILRELGFTQKRLGAVALASSGLADTVMWAGLALSSALAGIGGTIPEALLQAAVGIGLSIGFVLFVAGPILNRLIAADAPESALMTLAALSIFVSSAITGITHLHPVLGGFVAGVFLPDKVREIAAHSLDRATALVLMPFFFLNTGLSTNFSFTDPTVWLLFGISSLLCVFGKIIGHGIGARLAGENWPFALGVGLLLQTKGLMGIIVITVFRDKGIVSPLMFSTAVLMCMFSTGIPTIGMRLLHKRFGDLLTEGSLAAVGPTVGAADARAVEAAPSATSAPVVATLEFEQGLGSFSVTSPSAVIGRHSDDEIRINDIRVSRHHARLAQSQDGRFEIHNLTADRANA